MASHPAWKKHERKVARRAGTERTPLSGLNSRHDTNSDSLSEEFYIEAKWTGAKSSKFYLLAREIRAMKKVNALRITIDGMEMIAFESSKKDITVVDIDVEDHKAWKRWGVWSFFRSDVCAKGDRENKIPLLSIKMKGKRGEVVLCRAVEFERVKEVFHWHKEN